LAHDEIDIGYMIGPFDHSEFHSLLLASDPLYLVMPPNHRLTRAQELRPADLADEDLILGDMVEWEGRDDRLFLEAMHYFSVTTSRGERCRNGSAGGTVYGSASTV
jgi:DNA-binding transcriptional LysR family regulator